MKNETLKPIAQENNIVSDDELKDVSGGLQLFEMGTFGATTQSCLTKVRLINGSSCPTCGDTVGFISLGPDGNLFVKCEKCGAVILNPYRSDAVEVI